MVYDCDHPNATIHAIDLTSPMPCPDPDHDYEEPKDVSLQILQTGTKVLVEANLCKLEYTKTIRRCGFNSINYAANVIAWERSQAITMHDCTKALEFGVVTFEGKLYAVKPGTTEKFNVQTHGKSTDNGDCYGADFTSEGRHFSKSYELLQLKITLRKITGVLDLDDRQVVFPQGIRASYKKGYLIDDHVGNIAWNSTVTKCGDTVSELYMGAAIQYTRVNSSSQQDSILMVENAAEHQFAGLVLRGQTSLCGRSCWTTQIKTVVACLIGDGGRPVAAEVFKFKKHFAQQKLDLESQLSFSHLDSSLDTHARFAQIQFEICNLERKLIFTKLQSLAGTMNPYALNDLYGTGFTVTVAGAVAYVTQCVALDAQRVSYDNCTQEMPVEVNGQVMFADPFTRVLKELPTVIPCSDVMPVRWKVGEIWYCATPRARPCPPPTQLNSTFSDFEDFKDFTTGLGQGIYTPAQMYQHLMFKRSISSRPAILSRATNLVTSHDGTDDGYFGSFVSPIDYQSIREDIGFYFFPLFPLIGNWWLTFVGALLALCAVKVVVGCVIRAYILYKHRGMGWWMFGAVWSTLFSLVMMPWNIVKETVHACTDPVEIDRLPPIDPVHPYRGLWALFRSFQEEDTLRCNAHSPGKRHDCDGCPHEDDPLDPGLEKADWSTKHPEEMNK